MTDCDPDVSTELVAAAFDGTLLLWETWDPGLVNARRWITENVPVDVAVQWSALRPDVPPAVVRQAQHLGWRHFNGVPAGTILRWVDPDTTIGAMRPSDCHQVGLTAELSIAATSVGFVHPDEVIGWLRQDRRPITDTTIRAAATTMRDAWNTLGLVYQDELLIRHAGFVTPTAYTEWMTVTSTSDSDIRLVTQDTVNMSSFLAAGIDPVDTTHVVTALINHGLLTRTVTTQRDAVRWITERLAAGDDPNIVVCEGVTTLTVHPEMFAWQNAGYPDEHVDLWHPVMYHFTNGPRLTEICLRLGIGLVDADRVITACRRKNACSYNQIVTAFAATAPGLDPSTAATLASYVPRTRGRT